jgi:hypothetical protein
VQVHCEEGLAIHLGSEPCVCIRKDAGEVSAGERINTYGRINMQASDFSSAMGLPRDALHRQADVGR